jgi:hypothetical protein
MHYIEMVYRLAVSLWAGGNAIFMLVITPIIFKTESRDTAARLVGSLFPSYFRWGFVCGIIALICRLAGRGFDPKLPVLVLAVMLAMVSFQASYVEPHAAELKRQIGSFESTSKDHPLRKEFSKLHGVSMVCNLMVLIGGVILVVLT